MNKDLIATKMEKAVHATHLAADLLGEVAVLLRAERGDGSLHIRTILTPEVTGAVKKAAGMGSLHKPPSDDQA